MTNAVYWRSPVGEYDDFDARINHEVGGEIIDGKTRIGPWAIMTPETHARVGVGLGTGRGQRYVKQADGKWLKVEG